MKTNLIFLAAALMFVNTVPAQNWTWIRGSSSYSVAGTYGTMGSPASTNDPGGRHGCATWTDKSGNLWLFGGEGYTNTPVEDLLSDLWKYDKTTNQWTWIRGSATHNSQGQYGTKGTASASNDPGAREFSISWTDTSGKFWLFGGEGYDASGNFGHLNDLWRYDPSTNQWTWIQGSNLADQNGNYGVQGTPAATNTPGGRGGSGYWRDQLNNLWLFGGEGWPASGGWGPLNDLWKYTPSTNMWTWVKGTDLTTQPGVYGTLSVTASGNLPGGRSFPGCWAASSGELYMLGGVGNGTVSLNSHLSDLWKYDPASNNWTWIGGHYGGNFDGTYGTLGQAAATVLPGSRRSPATWVDALGKFWLFGGFGYAGAPGNSGNLNDLFRYDPVTGWWTWMKGDSAINMSGNYGTVGISAPTNKPGARQYNTYWKHTGSSLWLFGALGRDNTTNALANQNDLWLFHANCNPIPSAVSETLCAGYNTTLSVVPPDSSPISWYSTPSATIPLGTGSSYTTAPLNATTGPVVYDFYVAAGTCSQTPRTTISVTVYPLPLVSITGPTAACNGSSVTLLGSGAATYTWCSSDQALSTTFVASLPGHTCVVLGTDANGCENSASHAITVFALPQVSAYVSPTFVCVNHVATFSANGASAYSWSSGPSSPGYTATSLPTGSHQYSVTGTDLNGCTDTATVDFVVSPCVGIGEHRTGELCVFPNPGNGVTTLRTGKPSNPVRVEIITLLGQVLEEIVVAGETTVQLPAGVYLVHIPESGESLRLVIY